MNWSSSNARNAVVFGTTPNTLCPGCSSSHWTWSPVSGRGHIHTFTITHQPFSMSWAERLPYAVAVVELEEGVRLVSDLPEGDLDRIEIGQPVEVFFEDLGEKRCPVSDWPTATAPVGRRWKRGAAMTDAGDPVSPKTHSDARALPLAGIRVFDVTMFMAGPWASMLLGSLGAEVLHVEQPDVDWSQLNAGTPPLINGTASGYIAWNMNKRGVFIDLKDPDDLEFAYELIKTSDVFLTNMRPLERMGLGYEKLKSINPGLVYCHGTGYGRVGRAPATPVLMPVCRHLRASGLHKGLGVGRAKSTGMPPS